MLRVHMSATLTLDPHSKSTGSLPGIALEDLTAHASIYSPTLPYTASMS